MAWPEEDEDEIIWEPDDPNSEPVDEEVAQLEQQLEQLRAAKVAEYELRLERARREVARCEAILDKLLKESKKAAKRREDRAQFKSSDEARQQIQDYLLKHGPATKTEIRERLGISEGYINFLLQPAQLAAIGLRVVGKEGKKKLYTVLEKRSRA